MRLVRQSWPYCLLTDIVHVPQACINEKYSGEGAKSLSKNVGQFTKS